MVYGVGGGEEEELKCFEHAEAGAQDGDEGYRWVGAEGRVRVAEGGFILVIPERKGEERVRESLRFVKGFGGEKV